MSKLQVSHSKTLSNNVETGKYLYLYNENKEKYDLLQTDSLSELKLDTAGKYLITEKKLSNLSISFIIVIIAVVIVSGLAGTYIIVKKKYWFW